MGIFALVLGIIGGLSGVMGILVAVDVIPSMTGIENIGWEFWLMLAGILLLGSIAVSVGNRGDSGD